MAYPSFRSYNWRKLISRISSPRSGIIPTLRDSTSSLPESSILLVKEELLSGNVLHMAVVELRICSRSCDCFLRSSCLECLGLRSVPTSFDQAIGADYQQPWSPNSTFRRSQDDFITSTHCICWISRAQSISGQLYKHSFCIRRSCTFERRANNGTGRLKYLAAAPTLSWPQEMTTGVFWT